MLPRPDCDISTNVCCSTLYDVAQWLLSNVYDVLNPCVESTCSAPLLAYVTHGAGDDGVVDSLMVSIGSTKPSPRSLDDKGRMIGFSLNRTTFRVMLRESGWPMARVQGGDILAPDPVIQNALARHSYAHGEKLYRHLDQMRLERRLMPSTMPLPSFANISGLVPLLPSGGTVGWYVDVELDMQWNNG